jgi:hypothetical protein
MSNQYGGFDLDAFGSQLQGKNSSQQRYTSNSNNGPCMDNYDPNQMLGMPAAAARYNINGSSIVNGSSGHKTYMPSGVSATTAASVSIRTSQQHPNSAVYNDLSFDPISMRNLQQPPQQHQIVNQHLHNHQHVHHHHHHHIPPTQQTQYQNHHQPHRSSATATGITNSNSLSSSVSYSNNIFASQPHEIPSMPPQLVTSQPEPQQRKRKPKALPSKPEPWMENLQIEVSGVSMEPMNGMQIILKLKERTTEVLTRYLPCVHFLVQCQQDLRKGLAAATAKRLVHHVLRDTMTPRQFFNTYISNLPERFYRDNKRLMPSENLTTAVKELQKLCATAKAVESQGCEVVKNTFLGGMKDGESWGLRRWLSKQGGALYICNDTECLLNSCNKLDRSLDSTAQLASRLRPLAKNALKKLKSDVPPSYQEQSSAHPYLPFFHRLESALRGMSNFDPDDDDVICIDDDDEVQELKTKKPPPPPNQRRSDTKARSNKPKRKAESIDEKNANNDGGGGNLTTFDLGDSDVEILESKPPAKKRAKTDSPMTGPAALLAAVAGDDSEYMTALLRTFDDDGGDGIDLTFNDLDQKISPLDGENFTNEKDAYDLATGIDQLARLFDSNQHHGVRPDFVKVDPFWDKGRPFARVLRIFSDILRDPNTSEHFLDKIEDRVLQEQGKPIFSAIVKHPLCFRDIVNALLEDFCSVANTIAGSNGVLSNASLSSWNMWNGKELLQAIDLVYLNFLAYEKATDGGNKSTLRSMANKLRKNLWADIKSIIDEEFESDDPEEKRKCTPTRRGESSGFVARKINV